MQYRHDSRGLVVWFVRHGQSKSNAGEQTTDPAQIALTPLGKEQAAYIASAFEQAPDLIVTSPYLRAQQTAESIRHRFPSVAGETWPVQEFTYLDASRCANTSPIERRPMVEVYWRRNDPYHVDGEKAESYAELIGRADKMWERLAEECAGKWVVMVSHAGFIQASIWSRLYSGQKVSTEGMKLFRHFMIGLPMANGAILKVRDDGEWWWGPLETGYIPAHLQTPG
jgi:broad specificity phosphatase PhoE